MIKHDGGEIVEIFFGEELVWDLNRTVYDEDLNSSKYEFNTPGKFYLSAGKVYKFLPSRPGDTYRIKKGRDEKEILAGQTFLFAWNGPIMFLNANYSKFVLRIDKTNSSPDIILV